MAKDPDKPSGIVEESFGGATPLILSLMAALVIVGIYVLVDHKTDNRRADSVHTNTVTG